MIKTIIVDDSGLMRLRIRDILKADKLIKVVGTANNGKEALKMIKEEKPDVVVTDMVMPEFDGLYLVKEAMKNCPVPIVVMSALARENQQVFEALELGAFAFLEKPRTERGLGFNRPLIELIKAAANVNISKLGHAEHAKRNMLDHVFNDQFLYDAVVIGSSTGGPGAIEIFIEGLPAKFPVPIVVAQHMPEKFIISFAARLNQLTKLEVKVASLGEELLPNIVYLCSGEYNTEILPHHATGRPIFGKTNKKFVEFNHPSVDCLFLSATNTFQDRLVGIILTGMGKDGTLGLKALKNNKSLTIAQNESSCIVFGMPKSAIEENTIDYILNIHEIPGFLTSCFS